MSLVSPLPPEPQAPTGNWPNRYDALSVASVLRTNRIFASLILIDSVANSLSFGLLFRIYGAACFSDSELMIRFDRNVADN